MNIRAEEKVNKVITWMRTPALFFGIIFLAVILGAVKTGTNKIGTEKSTVLSFLTLEEFPTVNLTLSDMNFTVKILFDNATEWCKDYNQ